MPGAAKYRVSIVVALRSVRWGLRTVTGGSSVCRQPGPLPTVCRRWMRSGQESLPSWPVDTLLPADLSEKSDPDRYDVVVVGGLRRGAPAAVAAARKGSRVLLALSEDRLGGHDGRWAGPHRLPLQGGSGWAFQRVCGEGAALLRRRLRTQVTHGGEVDEGYHFEAKVAEAVFAASL